ncbi:MAG: glycyl-tRNA synthetase [Halobacteriales archaeon]|jgi:glycyl-tRNA synthetase
MTTDEPVADLAKRRGLFFPADEAYGGVAGFYAYGPRGADLKRRLEESWRRRFVVREGHDQVDTPTVIPEPVFEASGHLDGFDDALIACPSCDAHHRADHLVEDAGVLADAEDLRPAALEELVADHDVRCPSCGERLAGRPVEAFDLMFETQAGPGDGQPAYLRPETAQGTLVEFPQLKTYARNRLPFGVAQIGRGYRNEINPRKAIVRVRELTMAELQQFSDPERADPPLSAVAGVPLRLLPVDRQGADADGDVDEDGAREPIETTVAEAVDADIVANPWLAYYLGVAREWLERVGVDPDRLRFRQHREEELAHYAVECWDAEAEVSVGTDDDADEEWIELAGIADRGDHDLANHAAASNEAFTLFREYDEPSHVERPTVDPDMSEIGPRFGDRAGAVVDALERLAADDPEAFAGDAVTVDVDGEPHEIPAEWVDFRVEERTERGEHIRPQVVEPAFGVDRVLYAVVVHTLRRDVIDGEPRTVLSLPPEIAPTPVAVFPLTDDNAERARELVDRLRRRGVDAAYDDSGSIGRRYRRQDEVGTPVCVTLDERTPEDDAATLRDRDSTDQVRVPLDDVPELVSRLRAGETSFEALRAG